MPERRLISTICDGKGNILEKVYAEISDEQLDTELELEARELAIAELTTKKKAELREKG